MPYGMGSDERPPIKRGTLVNKKKIKKAAGRRSGYLTGNYEESRPQRTKKHPRGGQESGYSYTSKGNKVDRSKPHRYNMPMIKSSRKNKMPMINPMRRSRKGTISA